MKLKLAAAFAALTGAMMLGGGAHAAVGVSFDFGNVAVGYNDGYYDHSHNWHRWAHRADMRRWSRDHRDGWHNWRHDDRRHH